MSALAVLTLFSHQANKQRDGDGTVKKCEAPGGPTGHKWIGYTLFVPLGLDRPTADKNAERQTDDKSA